jgi:flavin reductase (DIM6/NTAB) family NADH-FMN oxidoreductase RutF
MDNATAPRAIDPNRFREVLGSYPTGVAVVTAMDAQGAPIGMVVGTFTSVSLEPPLVAFLPMKSSRTFDLMRKSPSFCINVLAADQEPICRKLAAPGENKFASIPWHASPAGNPVIDGVVSWIDCTYDNIIEAGDHYIVLGAVLDMNLERNTTPLLFFQRGYGGFSTGPLVAAAERDTLQAVGLAEAAREEIETLAARLSAECALLASTGRDSVYVAVANYSLNRRGSSRLGFHVPIVPPMGALFVGQPGSPDDETWLSRLGRCDESVREAATGTRRPTWKKASSSTPTRTARRSRSAACWRWCRPPRRCTSRPRSWTTSATTCCTSPPPSTTPTARWPWWCA